MATTKQKETALTVEMMEASEINQILLGGKVISLSTSEGKQKMQDGQPVYDHEGLPERWPDSHFVEFAFQGGSTTFMVSSEIYATLEEGKRYQMVGMVFMKTPYGEGRPYPAIKPKAFKFLF